MLKNPQELKDEILRRLGAPIINVEVTPDQIYDSIQRALELYGEYHYNGVNITYKVLKVDDEEKYRSGVFDLQDDNIFAVTKVLRSNSAMSSIITMDGSATYPWVTDFVLGLTTFGAGNTCKSYGPNGFGADLSYYTQIMQYWKTLQDMMSPLPDFWFNDSTGQLKLSGNFKKDEVIIVECYVKSFMDVHSAVGSYANYAYANEGRDIGSTSAIYDNPYNAQTGYRAGETGGIRQGAYDNRWVKNHATSLVKEINGIILAKHQGMALAGGTTVDGVRILMEAREEIEKQKEELYLLNPPIPILIG